MLALAAAGYLVVRSCGYDGRAVAVYGLYFAAHVMLPGLVVLRWVLARAPSWTTLFALGIPTGFAVEIFSFFAFASVGARVLLPCLPLCWGLAAMALWRRHGRPPLRWRVGRRHAGLAFALSLLFLCTVITAVSQMFSESPLVTGLPQRPIFHDWMYLVSRAAAIKQYWPLEDPSLAGTPLQYHYFMMVHAAAAASSTKLEITLVLLRLMIVALGAVLVVQAFALGRWLTRRAWGGVIAALLTVCAGGVSFVPDYGKPDFLDFFVRWLYVSPTFFFGVIFLGALLLAVTECDEAPRLGWRHLAWLALLAAAGTGAKGSVLPVVLLALAFWAVARWIRDRRVPRRLVVIGLAMAGSFLGVYLATMSTWGSGEASLEPFRAYHVTQFWQDYAIPWQRALKRWLQAPDFGTWLGASLCAMAVLAGTAGVRLLAIPYLLQPDPAHRRRMAGWVGAVFFSSCVFGTALHLDSNSELYFILPIQLPLAVLAAGFVVGAFARWQAWRAAPVGRLRRPLTWLHVGGVAFALAGLGFAFCVQAGSWAARSRQGLAEWSRVTSPAPQVREDLKPLYQTMMWLRENTEPDAVLVANAFTSQNLRTGRGIMVDHTTAGVHYYYSALSERRLWVEGPTYQLDVYRSKVRLVQASRIFYRGQPPEASRIASAPSYILLDHSIGDGARVALPEKDRVFTNGRFEVYRIPRAAQLAETGR